MDNLFTWHDQFMELIRYPFGLILTWNVLSLPIGFVVAVVIARRGKMVSPWLHRVAGFFCGLHLVAPIAGLVAVCFLIPFHPSSLSDVLHLLGAAAVLIVLPAIGGLIAWRSVWQRETKQDHLSIRDDTSDVRELGKKA